MRYKKNGWKLKRIAKESRTTRQRKKLLAKASWYKKKRVEDRTCTRREGGKVRMIRGR